MTSLLREFALPIGLALLLVLGVIPGALATGDSHRPDPVVTRADTDAPSDLHHLDSGGLYWSGQRLHFNGSVVIDDVQNASVDARTFRLRTVTGDDSVGTLVREFVVDSSGEVVLDTSDLGGKYVILYQGALVYVLNGSGYTSSPPDGADVTVRNSRWEVAEQTLSASWSDDHVGRQDTAALRVVSNRAAFLLEVSVEGLAFEDLASMFDSDDFAPNHDAKAESDVLILRGEGEIDFAVSFHPLGSGEYGFLLEVPDTDASTTATIRVGRVPADSPTDTPVATAPPTPAPPSGPPPTTTGSMTTISTTSTRPTASASPSTGTPEPTGNRSPTVTIDTPGQPGFGIVVALGALLATTLLSLRRRG